VAKTAKRRGREGGDQESNIDRREKSQRGGKREEDWHDGRRKET